MKKVILAKLAVHANPNRVVKEFTKKYGDGVFYDPDTHSIAKMEEEIAEKPVEKVVVTEAVSEEEEKPKEEAKPKRKKRKKK